MVLAWQGQLGRWDRTGVRGRHRVQKRRDNRGVVDGSWRHGVRVKGGMEHVCAWC